MHGYFLSLKLYTTARLLSNPSSYTEHREKVVESKIAAQQESRIRARKQQPKVNKALAERVRKQEEREEAKEKRRRERKGLVDGDLEEEEDEDEVDEGETDGKKKKKSASTTNILQDPRFAELWENPDFEVDEQSREYELLNPGSVHAAVSSRLSRLDGCHLKSSRLQGNSFFLVSRACRNDKRRQSRKKRRRATGRLRMACLIPMMTATRPMTRTEMRVRTVTKKEASRDASASSSKVCY